MEILTAKGTFSGLYTWGRGFENGVYCKWRSYWNQMDSTFWKHIPCGDCEYLVATGGSVYLHPMDFTLVYRTLGKSYSFGSNGRRVRCYPCIEDLHRLCDECAKACGGSFNMSVVERHEIECAWEAR